MENYLEIHFILIKKTICKKSKLNNYKINII